MSNKEPTGFDVFDFSEIYEPNDYMCTMRKEFICFHKFFDVKSPHQMPTINVEPDTSTPSYPYNSFVNNDNNDDNDNNKEGTSGVIHDTFVKQSNSSPQPKYFSPNNHNRRDTTSSPNGEISPIHNQHTISHKPSLNIDQQQNTFLVQEYRSFTLLKSILCITVTFTILFLFMILMNNESMIVGFQTLPQKNNTVEQKLNISEQHIEDEGKKRSGDITKPETCPDNNNHQSINPNDIMLIVKSYVDENMGSFFKETNVKLKEIDEQIHSVSNDQSILKQELETINAKNNVFNDKQDDNKNPFEEINSQIEPLKNTFNDLSSRIDKIENLNKYRQQIDYFDVLSKIPPMANNPSIVDKFLFGLQNLGQGKSNIPANMMLQHSFNINDNDMPNEIQAFDCACFDGQHGSIEIKLKYQVVVTNFEYVHIDKQRLPENLQSLGSKPKNFYIEGKKKADDEWIPFVRTDDFEKDNYSINIPIKNNELVEFLRVTYDNWGSPYTCFYRMHVRGN